MKKTLNQRGFAHLQLIILIVLVILAGVLVFWRVNNSSRQASVDSADELTKDEIKVMAREAEFIDEDHDLTPECDNSGPGNCEDDESDHDFDDDGSSDSDDSDDDDDGEEDDEDEDDDNDGNEEDGDDDGDDDDNDGLGDDDDPDDDNDGEEDDD